MWTLTHAFTRGAAVRAAACAAVVVSTSLLFTPDAAAAANREHQQIVADIRMLQEQTQQLQVSLGAVDRRAEDDRHPARRAGQRHAQGLRGSETDHRRPDRRDPHRPREARRYERAPLVAVAGSRIAALVAGSQGPRSCRRTRDAARWLRAAGWQHVARRRRERAGSTGGHGERARGDCSAPPPAAPPAVGMSPTRLYELAQADYAGGQWALAINGFETYLRTFPKTDRADDAQFFIGEAYQLDGKFKESVAAYDKVIADFPSGDRVPDAYYKRGLAYSRLGQNDKAQASRSKPSFAISRTPKRAVSPSSCSIV